MCIWNADYDADLESVEKFGGKKVRGLRTFAQSTKIWNTKKIFKFYTIMFYYFFFAKFEIRVKFCIFYTNSVWLYAPDPFGISLYNMRKIFSNFLSVYEFKIEETRITVPADTVLDIRHY